MLTISRDPGGSAISMSFFYIRIVCQICDGFCPVSVHMLSYSTYFQQQENNWAVAQLVEALRYKSVGLGFDSRWCHRNFSFWLHYGPGIDSASNRNEYQEYFLEGKGGLCVGLTNLPSSCADCLEIWDPPSPGTLRACPGQLYLNRKVI